MTDYQFIQLFKGLIDDAKHKTLIIMKQEIIKFNQTVNLISHSTIDTIDSVHFLDSILGAKIILNHSPASQFYDIGSGNGFPGLVLACLDLNRKFKLVESDKRKAEFIKHCAFKMNLNNVEVLNQRIENLSIKSPAIFISRAFSSIPKALQLYAKASQNIFEAYHFKSAHWRDELLPQKKSTTIVPHRTKCNYFVHKIVGEYALPHNAGNFFIIHSTNTSP